MTSIADYEDPQAPLGAIISFSFIASRHNAGLTKVVSAIIDGAVYEGEELEAIIKETAEKEGERRFVVARGNGQVFFLGLFLDTIIELFIDQPIN